MQGTMDFFKSLPCLTSKLVAKNYQIIVISFYRNIVVLGVKIARVTYEGLNLVCWFDFRVLPVFFHDTNGFPKIAHVVKSGLEIFISPLVQRLCPNLTNIRCETRTFFKQ